MGGANYWARGLGAAEGPQLVQDKTLVGGGAEGQPPPRKFPKNLFIHVVYFYLRIICQMSINITIDIYFINDLVFI